MAIVWRKHLPRFGRHPSKSARLEVKPDGSAEYASEEGTGSEAGPVGFSLPPLACSGRLDPTLHEKLVRAGQAVQRQGCEKGPQKRGMGRWTIETSYAGKKRHCAIRREGQAHADFEALREEAIDAICAAPPRKAP